MRWLCGACILTWVLLEGGAAHGQRLVVTVTAYASGIRTASGQRPQPGMIALSRDIERLLQAHFGDSIRLEGIGVFNFQDRMPGKPWYWHRRCDVYLATSMLARRFGIRRNVILHHTSQTTP